MILFTLENIEDAQIAWESLESARLIFSKMEGFEAQEKLSKVHSVLADLSVENGTLQAIRTHTHDLLERNERED